jgi:phenylpropionate dioxygenase-like ring-hydroxylating dioxygenase large terminal subunit
MMQLSNDDIAALVRPDRVHRRVYTDPAVFELEMERIFGRSWIYVGHESMVRHSGGFFLAQVGREPVVITRDEHGALHGLINRCPHRGARVCAAPRGNARQLTCPYHAWSFRLDGSLEALPLRSGYTASFDLADPANGMARVARIASYRGFIFVSIAAEGPDLPAHLGPMAAALDNMVDRSPTGALEAAGGTFRQEFAGNWKLHMENATDLIHPGVVHASSVASARSHRSAEPRNGAASQPIQMYEANGIGMAAWDRVPLQGFPQGHCYMGAFYRDGVIAPERQDPAFASYRAALVDRLGPEQADAVLARRTFNNLIYPNLSVNPQFQTLRLIQPIAVDRTVVHSACFRMVGAPDALFHQTITFLSTANSPASLVATDDFETFERCQRGLASTGHDWVNVGRNIDRDVQYGDGARLATGTSEMAIRVQYGAWLRAMAGSEAR